MDYLLYICNVKFLFFKKEKNMTKEEKDLLLKDLCARLPYQPYILIKDEERGVLESITVLEDGCFSEVWWDGFNYDIEKVKPYLRPMSSMTNEEKKIICSMNMLSDIELSDRLNYQKMYVQNYTIETFDLFNAHYLDYRGLIPMGLALEAPEGMYNTKD